MKIAPKNSNHWNSSRRKFPIIGIFIAAVSSFIAIASAQQAAPHIGYVFPAGGQRGSTFDIVVGGQFLNGVTNVLVSGGGVSSVVTKHLKILSFQQLNGIRNNIEKLEALEEIVKTNSARKVEAEKLRDQLTATLKGAGIEEVSLRAVREYTRKNSDVKKQLNPAISETVELRVTVDANAEPGDREIRLDVQGGLSNPMVFRIGTLPEFKENEPRASTTESGTLVTLPAVLNGQILPGDIDRFRFEAKKGARLVVAASARELIPYLADAVPGWFQATLALYDASGKEVAYDDDFRFNPDPVLFYQIPADGSYTVEIKDSIFRGREDFVYRITIGELPFITSIYPIGGPAGVDSKIELRGWNLPENKMTIINQRKEPGIYPVTVRAGDWISNPMPFAVDDLPECNESDRSETKIDLPVIVNGRIDRAGKPDIFTFKGKAGDAVVAEVFARRLNSPLDSKIKLTDAHEKQIAFNDDCEDKGSGLETHHADSYLCATLPADGTYHLQIDDTQGRAGPEYVYRLRVSPPRPDFALRVVPASVSVRPGGSASLTVYALRRDGFTNAISLALKDAPAGFKFLSGGTISGTQEMMKATVTVPFSRSAEPVKLNVEGRANIAGREVVHAAVPAEDMMQAFAYRHLVPAEELLVASARGGGGGGGLSAAKLQQLADMIKVISPLPVKIPAGGTVIVKLNAPGYQIAEKADLQLNDPPDGVTLKTFSAKEGGGEILLVCDANKAKTGAKGNLTIAAYAKKAPSSDSKKSRYKAFTLPAIPFEIVPK